MLPLLDVSLSLQSGDRSPLVSAPKVGFNV
jgi:hypothetical protein